MTDTDIPMKNCLILMLLLVATTISSTTQAEQLVREFSGSRTMQTAEFEVEAPWLIDWRVNSEFP